MVLSDAPASRRDVMIGSAFFAASSDFARRMAADAKPPARGFGEPSLMPRALAAASASLVRLLISSRSCCANTARMPNSNVPAFGMSAATISTPDFRRANRNAASRDRRSILAIRIAEPVSAQSARAASSCGRASTLPLSTSVKL